MKEQPLRKGLAIMGKRLDHAAGVFGSALKTSWLVFVATAGQKKQH